MNDNLCILVAYGRCIYLFGGYNALEQQHYGDILKFDTGNEHLCYDLCSPEKVAKFAW